ncbi:MAG: hypothetical protein MZU79_02800 [Anaerotruncus sp.]|nr:hypothetical protein [Anaerotruncus sp.]
MGDAEHGSYLFDLSAGTHTITFRAVVTPLNQALRDIQLLVDHINSFALNILKITGADIDTSRQWQFTNYIPETVSYLESYDKIIKYQVVQLAKYSIESDESATLVVFENRRQPFEKILEEPNKVPLYLSTLYSGTGSITQMLGDSLNALQSQQLYLDQFHIHNEGDLGRDNAIVLREIRQQHSEFHEFLHRTRNTSPWKIRKPSTFGSTARSIYVDLMQKMADQAFGGTDIKIKISIMPDANKLILANAAGNTPDIALGLPSYMPFDLAIRGALQDLTEFDDFWGVADAFAPGAFIPYVLEDNDLRHAGNAGIPCVGLPHRYDARARTQRSRYVERRHRHVADAPTLRDEFLLSDIRRRRAQMVLSNQSADLPERRCDLQPRRIVDNDQLRTSLSRFEIALRFVHYLLACLR